MGEDVKRAHQVVVVVEWLAHTHEHDVGKGVKFGKAEHLVDDFGDTEVFLETLFSRSAEEAIHLASHLGGDT